MQLYCCFSFCLSVSLCLISHIWTTHEIYFNLFCVTQSSLLVACYMQKIRHLISCMSYAFKKCKKMSVSLNWLNLTVNRWRGEDWYMVGKMPQCMPVYNPERDISTLVCKWESTCVSGKVCVCFFNCCMCCVCVFFLKQPVGLIMQSPWF